MYNTFKFTENYYLRKCFLERNQVPNQSLIRKKMSPALANIYFNSMTPKLKIIAGLEPSLKGGGENWYIPPKVLLEEERVVLKPLEHKYMSKWNCYGMDEIGMKWVEVYRRQMKEERRKIAYESDIAWNHKMEMIVKQHEEYCAEAEAKINTEFIKAAYREFDRIFTGSITQFQDLMFSAAVDKIKKYREEIFEKTQKHYEHLLHQQATMLYDRYTKKLDKTKEVLKQQFIQDLEMNRCNFINKLHDINLEKHIAVEKLRHYLECQTLACQIYVALKERIECKKEIESLEHEQRKNLKVLTGAIRYADIKIRLAKEKEKRRIELDETWQKKACLVVEALQQFVSYSLKEIPEQAEFFMNLEKLMMMQMNEAVEKPYSTKSQSVITEDKAYTPPKPALRPFYLFCNKRSKASVDSALCPHHVSSSASQMPVIVVNKRCIYSACDNFDLFTDELKDYVFGEGGINANLEDDHDYSANLNVTYTASQQLRELKLESSMMQILQQEIANIREVPIMCHGCRIPHCFNCFCCPHVVSPATPKTADQVRAHKVKTSPEGKITTRAEELRFEREPKWDSYIKYIESRKCKCHKTAKNLRQNLPIYMRKTSEYETPLMENYEKCSVATLKKLVRNAKHGRKYITPVDTPEEEERVRDEATQYSDIGYEILCNCFCEKCIADQDYSFHRERSMSDEFVSHPSPSFMGKTNVSFVAARTESLRRLINRAPQLQEIFINKNALPPSKRYKFT